MYKVAPHLILIPVLASMLFSMACRKDLAAPEAEHELLVPILNTKLSINEIVPDSMRKTGEDGLVTLVYRNPIYSSALESFQVLETREFNEVAKLQALTLSSKSAMRSVSLGQVAEAEGGVTGQLIISQHGSNSPIPPISGLTFGPIEVDGTAFFESVTLDSGYMDITLYNGFPSGLSNIDFEIRNAGNNALIGNENFATLPAGNTQTRTIDLAGKQVEGTLVGNILNLDIDGTGSTPVPIDTSDAIDVTITVRDMKVNSATAIFPAQDIISLADTNTMQNVGDLRLTKATAKTGFVTVRVVSTVEDTMYFNYFIPEGKKDGQPFEINERVNPAPSGGSIEKVFEFPVDGYTFDLSGMPVVNHYNAFYSELTGRIDSTGKQVHLSLQDSILVYVKLSQFVPEYIEGYLGHNSTVIGPQSVPISLFRNFDSGLLEFEEVKLNIGVENGNGVPFSVNISELSASNSKTGKSIAIDLNAIPNPILIDGAADINTPWVGKWNVDAGSGNAQAALNIYPNKMSVTMNLSSNPDEDSANLQQFAVDSNTFEAYLDIEVPLSLIADELKLRDTTLLNTSGIANTEQIEDGTLYLIVNNTLPFNCNISMLFLDEMGNENGSVDFSKNIGASPSGTNVETVLEWDFTSESINDLLTAHSVVFTAVVNSETIGFSHIYSDQSLSVSLSARFNYRSEP